MKIYQAEILDGLQEAIASSCVARCEFGLLPENNKVLASQNRDQPDLFYIDDAVLVSTNWNLNDDIFTKAEVWNARKTPIDKQFNHMHNDKFIIGHITKSVVVDYSGSLVPEDTLIENLPDFDISISSVIYKKIQDPEKAEIVAKLIEEIPQNKWCVSMECLFSDFDYGVLTPQGEHRTIARNDQSSFLTKHLRAYGGTGVYQGYKLGRILRNIAFSGVGSVDKPGNPRSVIKKFSFNGANASVQIFSEKVMSNEKEDTVSKVQYEELKKELASFKETAEKNKEKEMEEAKKANCQLQETIANLQKEIDTVKALSSERASKIEALEKDLAMEKENSMKMKEEAEKMKEEKKAQSRLTKLVEVGVDSTKASELVTKFASASDEMFDEVVALNTKKEEKKDKEEVKASDLDKTIDEKTIAQNIDQNKDQEVAKAAAEWFGSIFKKENK